MHSSRYVVPTRSLTTTAHHRRAEPRRPLLRFLPISDPLYNGPASPTYAPSPWLTPDAQGRVTWPLSYSITPNIVCITGGGAVWVSTQVEAQVRNDLGRDPDRHLPAGRRGAAAEPQISAACDADQAAG